MFKKRSTCATEYQECKAYWEWAQLNPTLREFLKKDMNEGKRSAITGYYMQCIGMRKGFPDYELPVPNKKYHGLYIEMKRASARGKALRQEQLDWINRLNRIGHYATFAYGADEAIRITTDYLNNRL
jgi:uncharacterized protein YecT (DUF1311 family)